MPETARRLTHEERLTLRHLVSEKRKEQTPYAEDEGRHHASPGYRATVDASNLYDRLTPKAPSRPALAARKRQHAIIAGPSLVELIGRLSDAV